MMQMRRRTVIPAASSELQLCGSNAPRSLFHCCLLYVSPPVPVRHWRQICDFGVACESRAGELVHEDHGPVGKLKYMAPEVFARHAYDPRKADVWSCGVILFIMIVSRDTHDRMRRRRLLRRAALGGRGRGCGRCRPLGRRRMHRGRP